MATTSIEEHLITCEDGFKLSSFLFTPAVHLKAAVLMAPATGIKKTFYRSLGSFLAENGYGVIAFENRGIGQSVKGSINDHHPSLVNWGRLDMSAALQELKTQFPDTTYHLIGHSAGGQLVGLMSNALEIKSMFNFACSSGYMGNIRYPFKVTGYCFLNIFMPISSLIFGKANNQWVGMGESLPKKVARQWSRWCNNPGYVVNDFGKEIDRHFYDQLTIPSKWVYATDDPIANLANVEDMIRVYSKIQVEITSLNPQELGYPSIGHMQFFSSKKQELWKMILDWLDEHL